MKLYKLLINIIFISLVGVAFLPGNAVRAAREAPLPVAHGEIIRDYARITFEWPSMVYFTASAEGKKLTITFDRKADPDFGQILATLYPYVTRGDLKSDGRTIVLTLNKPYRIRTFVSDNINGVDLLEVGAPVYRKEARLPSAEKLAMAGDDFAQLEPAAGEPAHESPKPPAAEPAHKETKEAAKPAAASAAPSAEKKSTSAVRAEPRMEALPVPAVPPSLTGESELPTGEETAAPSGETSSVAPAPVAEPAPKPAAEPISAPAPSAESAAPPAPAVAESPPQPAEEASPPAAEPTPPVPAEVPKIALPSVPAGEGDGQAVPLVEQTLPQSAPDGTVKINLSAASDNAILRIPATERMALAVFVRTRMLWIVFGKPVKLDLSDFNDVSQTVIGKAEILPAPGATILRMPINDGVYPSVTQETSNFDLAILITSKKRDLANALSVSVNTDPPAPPHVFIPALEITDPVSLEDPLVGDSLVITPTFNPSEGVSLARDFIEFSLLSTAQGIVVAKKADDVNVVPLRNGLRIALPVGAALTPGLPAAMPSAANTSVNVVTLFPYAHWKIEERENFWAQVRALFQKAVLSDNPQDANTSRLRLAQLFLSEGMAPEALAQLEGIHRTNPSYYRSAKLGALKGAANFLMHRFPEAARDFSAAELNNNKEVDYWRSMIADLLGAPDQTYDYLALNPDYISKYPPVFRQRLAIVSADRHIAAREFNMALKIFDTLSQDKLLDPIQTYVNFLMAKIAAETGQEEEAVKLWDQLAGDMEHPFVQARAEFSRIIWEMDHGGLEKEEAIDRLERLRLAWHGDSLELQVLTLLGDLYIEQNDYVSAMRIWNGGVMSFPNTATAIEMSRRMQETFITIFNEGTADKLPPLDALALYYEYRNYMPTGNTGNAMMERLADRLMGMDLLDQAAQLLDRQMRGQAEKEYRSRLGAKLGTIYLFNRQPQKALQALQDSMYGENSLMVRLMRNRLAAQALSDLNQPDKALATLGQDDSQDAERIRLSVYWRQKDWPKVIASVENVLKSRADTTAPVTIEESEYLLELSLAYVFQNDPTQLNYLRDYFGPLMEKNPNKPMFDFITTGDMALTTTNFDEIVQHLSDTRQFIEHYRARIKAEGLDAVVKPN